MLENKFRTLRGLGSLRPWLWN